MEKSYKVLSYFLITLLTLAARGQATISKLESEFDTAYTVISADYFPVGERQKLLDQASSGGYDQEHYLMAWDLWGLIRAWQATGREDLFEDIKTIINSTISTAVTTTINGKSFKHWPCNPEKRSNSDLWDIYYTKEVATFLRVMCQSPTLLASGDNQTWFDNTLTFFEKNVWERLEEKGADARLYGYDPYLSALSAQIAMEFYVITNKTKYKNFIDEVDFLGCNNCPESQKSIDHTDPDNVVYSSIRNQLRDTILNDSLTGFQISGNWADNTGNSDTSTIYRLAPDINHYSSLINYFNLSYENRVYWTKEDIDKWLVTVNKLVWTGNDPLYGRKFLNGSGPESYNDILIGYQTSLGIYNEDFQQRLENYVITHVSNSNSSQKTMQTGQILYNRVVLNNGRPVYPEYYPQ